MYKYLTVDALFAAKFITRHELAVIDAQRSVVGKSDEFIALLQSVDFFFEANEDLIVIGTFYFDGALISLTLS